MVECLGRFIKALVHKGDFIGLKPSSKNQIYSHQQFVDDSILMGEASIKNAKIIKKALNDYGQATGQLINWNKSSIYFINVNLKRQENIRRIMGCEVGITLGTYLRLPLYLEPPDSFWSSLVHKLHSKLVGWKGSLLR